MTTIQNPTSKWNYPELKEKFIRKISQLASKTDWQKSMECEVDRFIENLPSGELECKEGNFQFHHNYISDTNFQIED